MLPNVNGTVRTVVSSSEYFDLLSGRHIAASEYFDLLSVRHIAASEYFDLLSHIAVRGVLDCDSTVRYYNSIEHTRR